VAVLYIVGDRDFEREVFATERRGYWSAAFPLMLEKHGHLACDVAGPEALADPARWDMYDAVLIARTKPDHWTGDALRKAVSGDVEVLAEGPLPADLKSALGVTASRRAAEDGSLVLADKELADDCMRIYGIAGGGPIQRPAFRMIRRSPDHDWTTLERTPITALQASTWRAPGWEVELWHAGPDAEVLAEWIPWASRTIRAPAIVRAGAFTGCCASLFAYIGQAHTSEPFDGAEHRAQGRVAGVETLVLALIDAMHRRRGAARARVLPWPAGTRWTRSIRHDFDRALSLESTQQVLAGHARVGSAATWYWRAEPRAKLERVSGPAADLAPAALVATSAHHEVALHTELLWSNAETEQGVVETAIQRPVVGTTAHGARNCFRYQGAPNVLWAEQRGMLYTELLQQGHLHLHRFAAMSAEGAISPLRVLCLPQHVSFDLSMSSANAAGVEAALPTWIRARGFLQIMNHPDINTDALFELLGEMPGEGRADWTAAEAAHWWLRAHSFESTQIERLSGSTFAITSVPGVERLNVEVLHPDGAVSEHTVTVDPGESVEFQAELTAA
jgi:hypothetical protein